MRVLGLETSRDRLLFDAALYKLWKIEVPSSSSPQSAVDKADKSAWATLERENFWGGDRSFSAFCHSQLSQQYAAVEKVLFDAYGLLAQGTLANTLFSYIPRYLRCSVGHTGALGPTRALCPGSRSQ